MRKTSKERLPSNEIQGNIPSQPKGTSRRDFLKLCGYSFASAALLAACKRPIHSALPYIIQPPEIAPGKALYYASSYFDGHEYCSIVVKTRDGRPIKIEGNELSPFNFEGTSARVQASVLNLYDDARPKGPMTGTKSESWEIIDANIQTGLEKVNSASENIVLLTSTIISPATKKLIEEFGSGFSNFRWIQYDAISYSAILEANERCFGFPVFPDIHFRNTDLIVSVNADFIGTWGAPVHFVTGYSNARNIRKSQSRMLRHIQYESGMTLSGANADIRRTIKPSEEKTFFIDLYNRIAKEKGEKVLPGQMFRDDLSDIAGELLACGGRSAILSGSNDINIQIIVNSINWLLGNYGSCIDLQNCLNISSGIDRDMKALVEDMSAGKVGALLMYNVNPAHDYFDAEGFKKGLSNTLLTVNMSYFKNETSGLCTYDCPVNNYLESWDDAEIIPGQLSLVQPCIHHIFDTRQFQDSLLKWAGRSDTWLIYLKNHWEKEYFPLSDTKDFENFWTGSLKKGVFEYSNGKTGTLSMTDGVRDDVATAENYPDSGGFEVILAESVSLGTGMLANNPWLMELPDPISKHCWENLASISPGDATRMGISTGDVIKIDNNISLPAFIQPGQADGTISIALGYGHTSSGPVCNGIGENMYRFVRDNSGNRIYNFWTAKVERTGENKQLALTQTYASMEGRPIVRRTQLSNYRRKPSSGNEMHEEFEKGHGTLYPDIEYDGFHWGLAIDLNLCTGCNSCVIACQAENNIPVVGKEEVTKRRIMHWIKIDRYYSDDDNNPEVFFQPLPCQHCENAPCENVCPVSATNHSNEGLNQMAYNRCIGTKYCINNCPYKVRRFNWFRYTNNKEFNFNTASELGKMVLNPDVTVRERGVVEKCSYCVQRIQEKKLQAKLENRPLRDQEIKTACMQACPAGAIVFGNLNDKKSKVAGLAADSGNYHLLEELHTLPSTSYLTKIRNDEIPES